MILLSDPKEMTGIGRIVYFAHDQNKLTKFLSVYEGEIIDGKPHGFGRFFSSDTSNVGNFHSGRFMRTMY